MQAPNGSLGAWGLENLRQRLRALGPMRWRPKPMNTATRDGTTCNDAQFRTLPTARQPRFTCGDLNEASFSPQGSVEQEGRLRILVQKPTPESMAAAEDVASPSVAGKRAAEEGLQDAPSSKGARTGAEAAPYSGDEVFNPHLLRLYYSACCHGRGEVPEGYTVPSWRVHRRSFLPL